MRSRTRQGIRGRKGLDLVPASGPVRQGTPGGEGLGPDVIHSRPDRRLLGPELDPVDAVELAAADLVTADIRRLEMIAADDRHGPVVG